MIKKKKLKSCFLYIKDQLWTVIYLLFWRWFSLFQVLDDYSLGSSCLGRSQVLISLSTTIKLIRLPLGSNDQIKDQKFRPSRYTEESDCFKFSRGKKTKKKKKDYRFFCGLQLGRDLYRLVVCAFTRLIYLIAKGQSRNMLSLCCVRARIQWIFTSPLSQYLFFLLQH